MSEAIDQERPAARLWTTDGFVADLWTRAEALEDGAPAAGLILPLAVWIALEPARRAGAGVHVAPGEAIAPLLPTLHAVPLVSLGFPAFNDGRSFSKAALLVARHGYRGALRAAGDVLIDLVPHMIRVGFTEFEITHPTTLARLEAGRLGGLPLHYQPAARAEAGGRYAWRRVAAA